jgi:hypothetical protein
MKDPIAGLGDLVREMLTFCYSDAHKESLRLEARKMGCSMDQVVAAAIAHRVSEIRRIRCEAQRVAVLTRQLTAKDFEFKKTKRLGFERGGPPAVEANLSFSLPPSVL